MNKTLYGLTITSVSLLGLLSIDQCRAEQAYSKDEIQALWNQANTEFTAKPKISMKPPAIKGKVNSAVASRGQKKAAIQSSAANTKQTIDTLKKNPAAGKTAAKDQSVKLKQTAKKVDESQKTAKTTETKGGEVKKSGKKVAEAKKEAPKTEVAKGAGKPDAKKDPKVKAAEGEVIQEKKGLLNNLGSFVETAKQGLSTVQELAPAVGAAGAAVVGAVQQAKGGGQASAPAVVDNQVSGAAETKPEEKKAEEAKPEEKKAEEAKPEEKKAEEAKPEEKKAEEAKPEEKKAEEAKPEEKKAEEVKPVAYEIKMGNSLAKVTFTQDSEDVGDATENVGEATDGAAEAIDTLTAEDWEANVAKTEKMETALSSFEQASQNFEDATNKLADALDAAADNPDEANIQAAEEANKAYEDTGAIYADAEDAAIEAIADYVNDKVTMMMGDDEGGDEPQGDAEPQQD